MRLDVWAMGDVEVGLMHMFGCKETKCSWTSVYCLHLSVWRYNIHGICEARCVECTVLMMYL